MATPTQGKLLENDIIGLQKELNNFLLNPTERNRIEKELKTKQEQLKTYCENSGGKTASASNSSSDDADCYKVLNSTQNNLTLLPNTNFNTTTVINPDANNSEITKPETENQANQARGTEAFDNITNFEEQYDIRLDGAYRGTYKIGNNMPDDENYYVGVPSMMNPLALIRFDKVVGPDQHMKLLDTKGNFDIRSAIRSKNVMNVADLGDGAEEAFTREKATGLNTISKQVVGDDDMIKIGGETAFVDVRGNVYNLVEDRTQRVLKKQSVDSKLPDTINVPSTPTPAPATKEYWYGYFEWTLCTGAPPSLSFKEYGGFMSQDLCKRLSGETKEPVQPEEAKQITKMIADKALEVQSYVDAKYIDEGFVYTKEYILADQSSPTLSEAVEPYTENLCNIDAWKGREQFAYDWADFLYCGGFHKIPNTYLVTLRRFVQPVWDHAAKPNSDNTMETWQPIAKAVTWMGLDDSNKMSDLMNMTWGMKWGTVTAQVNTENISADEGPDMGKIGGFAKYLGLTNNFLKGGTTQAERGAKSSEVIDPYQNGPKSNDPMGPVNSINETQRREVGLDYKQDIKLNFLYDLNAFGAANAKIAALDIIANMLALTFSDAPFWGGANRFHKQQSKGYFPGDTKGLAAFRKGDFGGWIDSIGDQMKSALSGIADMLGQFFNNPMGTLAKMGNNAATMWMSKKNASSRPQIISFKSLLTGEPIGEWHLMIGNPFNPMAMMGNMIVKDVNLTFPSEVLGADDFPTRMKFEVTLAHGKPRDKGDIESIFNQGKGKLHYAYKGQDGEPWNTSAATQTSKISKPGRATDGINGTVNGTTNTNVNQSIIQTKPAPVEKIFQSNKSKQNSRVMTNNQYFTKLLRSNMSKIAGGLQEIQATAGVGFKNKLEADKNITGSVN